MSKLMNAVDERTKLAGANRLEVLLFSLGKDKNTDRSEVYGINVFKVREVMRVPDITHAPDVPDAVEGMVSLRGSMIPVINLCKFCDIHPETPPEILIITEYNRFTQAVLVHSVESILRLEWTQVKVPPPMMANRMGGLLTAVTQLTDNRIVMILDVEKVLADTGDFGNDPSLYDGIEELNTEATILFADDSVVARKQIETTFNKVGIKHISAKNGKEAWIQLDEIAKRAQHYDRPVSDYVAAVLTDVEMPEMDGYVLTKRIKNDPRFKGIPVVMHSSLSADANKSIGYSMGADHYVPKFDPRELTSVFRPIIKKWEEDRKVQKPGVNSSAA
ncbi:MAG: fused signal transduction protein/response regulator [Gammaproteobacteria bacterium]|nr:chemotaxis protein CheV [Beggiatoa alba]PCH60940.1 MAG: fused signal transduction protein/response regulator [Gammaproteobacteria bacterium]